MKITLIAVSSIDGFITKGRDSNIYSWTSKEDQDFFFNKIEKAKLIFMGAKTYDNAKHLMKHKKGRIRVVFTRTPEKYTTQEIPGMLEFTKKSPLKVVEMYKKHGIKKALLVGGLEINSLFLKQNLVSELLLTIEPFIFGSGKKLLDDSIKLTFRLNSIKQMNKKGTLLLRYFITTS